MTEVERHLVEHMQNRRFFRWQRLWLAIRRDPTIILEFAVSLLGLILNGALIAFAITTFPPPDVRFLLRSWPLMGEHSLGLVLLVVGILQALGTLTEAHRARAAIAFLAFAISTAITVAYAVADLPAHFQAWVMYLSISACEFYLFVRNIGAHRRLNQAQQLVRETLHQRIIRESLRRRND